MARTATNPVTVGYATKKAQWDALWNNAEFNFAFINIGLVATVSAKALTVALKGADGNNPAAANPVAIGFRSATIATGTPVFREISGALSVVLSSGSTLGFTAAQAGRIYVWAIDNAGTVELALSRSADIFPETNLVTTTAEGGAGAADSATVMYSATARTNVACRCLGYVEITTGATAGEWDNAPTKIQIMGPGVKRTGDIIQRKGSIITAASGGLSTTLPYDATIPQITEGDQIFSQAITPKSAINELHFDGLFHLSNSGNGYLAAALFNTGAANAIAVAAQYQASTSQHTALRFFHKMVAGAVTELTFTVRAGANGNTTYLNSAGATQYYGGVMISSFYVNEIMV